MFVFDITLPPIEELSGIYITSLNYSLFVFNITLEELSGIYITSLNPTGAAARHGQVKEGDRILKVDDTSLRGLENMEAASVLRNSGNPVRLVLSRHKEHPPSPESEWNPETTVNN